MDNLPGNPIPVNQRVPTQPMNQVQQFQNQFQPIIPQQPSSNSNAKQGAGGLKSILSYILAIVIALVFIMLLFGVLNYLNIVSLSTLYPKLFGFLPHKIQTIPFIPSEQILPTPSQVTPTPQTTPAPQISLLPFDFTDPNIKSVAVSYPSTIKEVQKTEQGVLLQLEIQIPDFPQIIITPDIDVKKEGDLPGQAISATIDDFRANQKIIIRVWYHLPSQKKIIQRVLITKE